MKSDKSLLFLSPQQNKLKEIWDKYCKRKTAEDDNVKIKASPVMPCTLLVFKGSAFLQIFFPRKTSLSFGLLLKPGLGSWTRTLKNLDPKKPGP